MDTESLNKQAQLLKSLHVPGNPLILANVYDIPSARTVAALPSCKALATASFAVALANGTEDKKLTLEINLQAVRNIGKVACEFDKPLSVDLQDGCLNHARVTFAMRSRWRTAENSDIPGSMRLGSNFRFPRPAG